MSDLKTTENTFVDYGDRIVIYDDLGEEVIYDGLDYSEYPEESSRFLELFERVEPEQGLFLADPTDTFYQGVEAMCVIRRRADGMTFGFQYWTPIAKYSELELEGNGEECGFEFNVPDGFDWDNDYYPKAFVFEPVEPFLITGFQFANKDDGDE